MRNQTTFILAVAVIGIFLQGCASGPADRNLDNKIAQETEVQTHSELRTQADRSIPSMAGLTADQKARLETLKKSTRSQLDQLWQNSIKLRSVLIDDLLSSNYNEDEVELIKQRVKEVEDKRLTVIFAAIDQANAILGRNASENRQLLEEYFQGHGSRD